MATMNPLLNGAGENVFIFLESALLEGDAIETLWRFNGEDFIPASTDERFADEICVAARTVWLITTDELADVFVIYSAFASISE